MERYAKLIYVAGPYTALTPEEIRANIAAAEAAAVELWRLGWAVICPHLNTAGFEQYEDDVLGRDTWIRGDLTILKRCDAVFLLQNFSSSPGALIESDCAGMNNIPVYHERQGYPKPEDLE